MAELEDLYLILSLWYLVAAFSFKGTGLNQSNDMEKILHLQRPGRKRDSGNYNLLWSESQSAVKIYKVVCQRRLER